MDHLSKEQIAHLKRQLEEDHQRLRDEIRDELLRADEERYADVAGQVHDPGDESVADLLADMHITNMGRRLTELREIEEALERMRERVYGICEDSGDAIPYKRLEAYPTARRTVEYQERHEQTHAVQRNTTL